MQSVCKNTSKWQLGVQYTSAHGWPTRGEQAACTQQAE